MVNNTTRVPAGFIIIWKAYECVTLKLLYLTEIFFYVCSKRYQKAC